jgi:hypothetical protein
VSKRKAYRPRPVKPHAYLIAIQGAALLSEADRLERANRLAAAVEVACMGAAERPQWALIVDALNMAEMFARQRVGVGRDALPLIEGLQTTVETILDRRKAGSKALHASERDDLRAFAEAYADLLGTVTHRQYFEAQEAAENRARRILAGEKIPAGRVVEVSC